MIINTISVEKGEKLVQIYDPNQNGTKVFLRTATPINVSKDAPITPPNGMQDITMISDRKMVVKVNTDDKIFDQDGSIYAKYLSE